MSTSEPGATVTSDTPVGYRESSGQYGESQGAQGAKEQAQEKAQQAAGQAQEKAQQAAGQAKGRAKSVVDERSTQAGEQVSQQASDVRSVAESLREQGKEGPAKVAEQAADRAERLGGYLKHSNADDILGDIEDFGRRQPLAIALGGLALGFFASRFLKASSSERYQQYATGQRPMPSQRRRTPALPPTTGGAGNTGSIGTTGARTGTATTPPLASTPPTTPAPPVPPAPGTNRI